jgi:hypothetical protein
MDSVIRYFTLLRYLDGTRQRSHLHNALLRLCGGFAGSQLQPRLQVLPMNWSATPSQIDRPFGSWADDLAAAFVQLEPRKISEHPFHGTIVRTETAPVRISRVIATRHKILRLRSHIARSKDDLCFINLQLEGVGRYTQHLSS